jgi:hypothetical protein
MLVPLLRVGLDARGLDLDLGARLLRVVRDLDPAGEVDEPAANLGQDVPGDELHRCVRDVQLVLPCGRQLDASDLLHSFCHLGISPLMGLRLLLQRGMSTQYSGVARDS